MLEMGPKPSTVDAQRASGDGVDLRVEYWPTSPKHQVTFNHNHSTVLHATLLA